MPQLSELQTAQTRRKPVLRTAVELVVEETLVPDQRAARSTSQMMEDKLRRLTGYRLRSEKSN